MTTRDIRPQDTHTVCDLCGRTLLRGEHADVYINGGSRRSVCELCTTRALHEGWVREGALQAYTGSPPAKARRRSLFGRLRAQPRSSRGGSSAPPSLDDELGDDGWLLELAGSETGYPAPPAEQGPSGRPPSGASPGMDSWAAYEPRHVHAVPTSDDHKSAAALEAFNASEHPRTVAGVARSLGAPGVAVVPDSDHPTLVRIVVAWELCWYRYEVDLDDHSPSVRVDGQGYELSELDSRERAVNAVADDVGRLSPR
jgi:hypothetical protein